MHSQQGVTLTELLVVVALIAILSGMMLPGSQRLVDAAQGDAAMRSVHAAVSFARNVAITTREPAVLCSLDDHGRCDGDWTSGFAVFTDRNDNARRDEGERVHRRIAAVPEQARLSLRAFRTGRYLRLLPTGQTDWQNGRFIYCPPAGSESLPHVLVLNIQGRARAVEAQRVDGLPVEPDGRAIPCSP